MKITKISETIQQLDLSNDLINKNVHLVCISLNSLTIFQAYAVQLLGMSFEDADKHVKVVNNKNEVGTFFPQYNITIVPLSIHENRNDFGNREVFDKHVQDCFDANEKHIKCDKVIFGFENRGDFDFALFEEVLSEKVKTYNFVQTKEIVFYNI